jgi:hypothetical protein
MLSAIPSSLCPPLCRTKPTILKKETSENTTGLIEAGNVGLLFQCCMIQALMRIHLTRARQHRHSAHELGGLSRRRNKGEGPEQDRQTPDR